MAISGLVGRSQAKGEEHMSREAIEEAIEVLEDASAEMLMETGDKNYYIEAIAVLRQALETEQEPFEYWNAVEGWVKIDEVREHFDAVGCGTIYKSAGEGRSPLYTAPPKKEWVGLTVLEVYECWKTGDVVEAVEAKLKEKNT
jgi:hypothetical protein